MDYNLNLSLIYIKTSLKVAVLVLVLQEVGKNQYQDANGDCELLIPQKQHRGPCFLSQKSHQPSVESPEMF